jgi:hypothetical protein
MNFRKINKSTLLKIVKIYTSMDGISAKLEKMVTDLKPFVLIVMNSLIK